MKLLAIDPGTKSMGLALYEDGILLEAGSIKPTGRADRLARIENLIDRFAEYLYFRKPEMLIVEDPLLKGVSNAAMERLKGSIEATSQIVCGWMNENYTLHKDLIYLAPTFVKKHMGHGHMEKDEMAAVAKKWAVNPTEKEIVEEMIQQGDFDATDAICIGLAFLNRKEPSFEVK